jgi:hypothetical protein
MEKSTMNEKIKELQNKIKSITFEELTEFSKAWKQGYFSGLHKYSFFNFCIANFQLKKQGKFASALASFKTWSDKGFRVKSGEKAVSVFAPILIKKDIEVEKNGKKEIEEKKMLKGYRLVPVFDISQTDGDISKLTVETGGLTGKWTDGKSIINFDNLVEKFKIPVRIYDVSKKGENGSTDGKSISILKKENEEMITTFLHEIAHFNLHFGSDRKELTPESKECEAETVSYLVSIALGIDNKKSALYIKGWNENFENVSVKKIMNCTEKMLKTIFSTDTDSQTA